jgi:hypothetical protein
MRYATTIWTDGTVVTDDDPRVSPLSPGSGAGDTSTTLLLNGNDAVNADDLSFNPPRWKF